MRKLLVAVFFGTFSFNALGFGGMGDIVSDPKSYTYYAEQIKTAKEALQSAKDQLQTALEAKDIAQATQKNLEGTYRRAQRAVSNFKTMKERLENDPMRFAESMIRDRRDVDKMMSDTANKVSRVYSPAQRSMDDINAFAGLDDNGKKWSSTWQGVKSAQRKIARDELQKAVAGAEIVDALALDQIENIQDLSIKANSAMTQKDATDVTNALLLQMVEQNSQMVKLLSTISRNFALTELASSNNKTEDMYQNLQRKLNEPVKNNNKAKKYFNGGMFGSYADSIKSGDYKG